MPVVLKPENFEAWMDLKTPGPAGQKIIADSLNKFASYPVSTKVNNARNDFADLLEPLNS